MKELRGFVYVCIWIAGIVIAKGFWSTFFAVLIPLWSYYLVIERIILYFGV